MVTANLAGKRVLYISYNGMLDPLGQSQVIPYLKELARLDIQFTLMSFERREAFTAQGTKLCEEIQRELSSSSIDWHRLWYHKSPTLPATAFDVAAGVRLAGRLVRQQKIQMIHARAHIPAVMALRVKQRHGTKIIFDVRGLMAEEYIDAEHWTASGIPARITKGMEARVLRVADGIVTLTDALWNAMQGWPCLQNRSVVHEMIPCCIDLEKFRLEQSARRRQREELGLSNRFVLVYSGSIGGWYSTDEMAEFFSVLKQRLPDAFFLWLTQGAAEIVTSAMQRFGINEHDYEIRNVAPQSMPGFLSAADAGIAFYRPGISRLGTSPVKVNEYLACGLPVVINSGIGDCDQLFASRNLGAVVGAFNRSAYEKAARQIQPLIDEAAATRLRARTTAEELFDLRKVGVPRYARMYQRLLNN